MKNIIFLSFPVFAILLFFSCKKDTANVDSSLNPIVSVNDKVLYRGQLSEVLPYGLSADDSLALAETYIKTWINDELMYNQAERNVIDRNHIEKLVADYRRSLIVNMYQEQLLHESLSKNVTNPELEAFYNENIQRFNLKENIIKGLYLKVPVNSPLLANFQKWYKQGSMESIENIEKNNLQNVVNYDYFYNKWSSFDEVMEKIPIVVDNQQQYLKNNKNIEVRDSAFVYLLNIKEYKLAGTTAPFDYIEHIVKEVYLEKKRADYMQQIQKDLYDKALSKGEIKFYTE